LSVPVSAPELLTEQHEVAQFSCGDASLEDWLKKRALANQASGATRTYVACADGYVAGYYAIASGAVHVAEAPGRFRRNMPDPIPVAVLGRLAVDSDYQGRGIGRALFRDAAIRICYAADVIGIRGILVHAISEKARAFYMTLGFDPSPGDPMTLLVTLSDVRKGLA
jgi:GNAT superfamily N-acetyltransferase